MNAAAVGAGLGLVMVCDLQIAGRLARFATGFTEIAIPAVLGNEKDGTPIRDISICV
ncbi:MAG: hypothetical protein ACJ8AH_09460 [Stellaceae bacterium]